MIRILFVVLLISFVSGDNSIIQKCDSPGGNVVNTTIKNSRISGGRYLLKRNTKAGIGIEFEIFDEAKTVTAEVAGVVLSIPIPFILPNANGCTSLKCPLQKGGPYKYYNVLDVLQAYPMLTVDVIWKLKDENQKVLACIIIPARIVA
ncbi:NPC intracellular cholesterol transporter 2 homolog a-like [Leptopilina heterotoma]|uniref:NPC intracellular cholesterol transporter 2 homolog a-like n=1 Tax=Leptopilina heterotoma TaxID=63436 RepID=UPI001CA98A8D|nr:NPC intracellular cholesterol transporter 2 homolog a-like [Leptopilina heterotoma]